MAHFILVHGMFHGGWCFAPIADRLRAHGHTVDAPDLAGCGGDATPAAQVTLEGWADDVVRLIEAAEAPVVLLGHSRGGIVISRAAEKAPEKLAVLVYLTALLLPNGASPMSLPEIMKAEGVADAPPGVAPKLKADGSAMLPPDAAETLFYAGCSAEERAWAMGLIGEEPLAPLLTPLQISAGRWGSVPRVYVETTQDVVLPIAAQRAMVAHVGADEVISLASDHMPILGDCAALATVLDDVAARYAGSADRPG